jgi:hypothetical protein
MTISSILQVFHSLLCPIGHGGLYETLRLGRANLTNDIASVNFPENNLPSIIKIIEMVYFVVDKLFLGSPYSKSFLKS